MGFLPDEVEEADKSIDLLLKQAELEEHLETCLQQIEQADRDFRSTKRWIDFYRIFSRFTIYVVWLGVLQFVAAMILGFFDENASRGALIGGTLCGVGGTLGSFLSGRGVELALKRGQEAIESMQNGFRALQGIPEAFATPSQIDRAHHVIKNFGGLEQ